jgi:hypothetical protein
VSLMDEARAESSRRGTRCSVRLLLESVEPGLQIEILAALADQSIEGTALGRVLRARQLKIGNDAIQRHRRKVCACLS